MLKWMLVVSWIFMQSTYSNMQPTRPFVEALPDQRCVTWGYSRKVIRHWDRNGGYYRVQYTSY